VIKFAESLLITLVIKATCSTLVCLFEYTYTKPI
jgi:hypothetical protein